MNDDKNINVSTDNFLTDTRMATCFAQGCRYNTDTQCQFKQIHINEAGGCGEFEQHYQKPRTLADEPAGTGQKPGARTL